MNNSIWGATESAFSAQACSQTIGGAAGATVKICRFSRSSSRSGRQRDNDNDNHHHHNAPHHHHKVFCRHYHVFVLPDFHRYFQRISVFLLRQYCTGFTSYLVFCFCYFLITFHFYIYFPYNINSLHVATPQDLPASRNIGHFPRFQQHLEAQRPTPHTQHFPRKIQLFRSTINISS